MSGGHSDAYFASMDRPVEGRKRCHECGAVKSWPSAFVSHTGAIVGNCTACTIKLRDRYARRKVAWAWKHHQRQASPSVGCVLPALPTGPWSLVETPLRG